MERKISSSVGCFSMYSTFAGGRSCFEFVEGSACDDSSVVQDRDPVRELFCFVEVLRCQQDRRAGAGEFLDGFPDFEPSLRIESGRRLVEEDDCGCSHQAHGDVEPAGHAAGVGIDPLLGRVGQPELLQQAVGDLGRVGHGPQFGNQNEVLPAGENAVHGGELARQADLLAHSFRLTLRCRNRRQLALPLSGVSSVDRMLTAVVLPAPFDPSSAKICPRRTSRSTPFKTLGVLEGLLSGLSFLDGDVRHCFVSSSRSLSHHVTVECVTPVLGVGLGVAQQLVAERRPHPRR